MYANMTETPIVRDSLSWAEIKTGRAAALAAHMAAADSKKVNERLSAVASAAGDIIENIIAAYDDGATLSQIRDALNGGLKGDITAETIAPRRWTEQYETLRRRTAEYEKRSGKTFDVFLANMGPVPQHKPRAEFSTGFLEVAQFNVLGNNGFPTVDAAAEAACGSGAVVTVICSTDATYPELVPPLTRLIKEKCPDMLVLLAGAPAPEYKSSYLDAGVDDFIHVRVNCLELLTMIQDKKGV
jgi:methylmalonyl-CoA mutase